MNPAIVIAVGAVVMLFALTELAAAVLPLIIILAAVPPEDRRALAELIAAADSSRRLRLWPALMVAIRARRLVAVPTGNPFASAPTGPHHSRASGRSGSTDA